MENKEYRNLDIEFRLEGESREVSGYAIVFNSLSHDLGGFREEIMPEAMNGVIERSDCVALLNHDPKRGILGRSRNGKGSLKLSVDETGMRFDFNAPKTALGDEALEYLRRGDANQCSFAFTIADGGDRWTKQSDGTYLRQITQFDRIYDCSILTCTPAYEATSVSCKRFEEVKEEERIENERKLAELKAEEERQAAEAEEARKQALAEYYANLKEEYKDILEK